MAGIPLNDVLLFVCLASCMAMAFAIGAQDAAFGIAPAVGSGVLRLETALVLATVGAVVVSLALVPSGFAWLMDGLFPFEAFPSPRLAAVALFAGFLSTAIVLVVATLLGQPTPSLLVLGGALAGVVLSGAPVSAFPAAQLAVILGAVVGLPVVSGLIAFLAFRLYRSQIHFGRSVRRGARIMMPISAALVVLAVGAAVAFGFGLNWLESLRRGDIGFWAALAVVIGATGLTALTVWLAIARRRTWPGDDVRGAEIAYGRLTGASALALAGMGTAYQAVLAATPALLVVAWARQETGFGTVPVVADAAFGGDLRRDVLVLLPTLVGLVLGILFMGHRTIAAIGEDVSRLTPIQALSATLSSTIVFAGAGSAAVPVIGSPMTAGAVAGAGWARGRDRVSSRPLLFMLLTWAVALLSAGLLAAFLRLIGDALVV